MLESLCYHWDCAKSYFLSSSDGGEDQSTNQRPGVVDESRSSDSGHSSPLSLLLIITLMNEAITTSLVVPSSFLTQRRKSETQPQSGLFLQWCRDNLKKTGREQGLTGVGILTTEHPTSHWETVPGKQTYKWDFFYSSTCVSLLLFGVPIKKPSTFSEASSCATGCFVTIFCHNSGEAWWPT